MSLLVFVWFWSSFVWWMYSFDSSTAWMPFMSVIVLMFVVLLWGVLVEYKDPRMDNGDCLLVIAMTLLFGLSYPLVMACFWWEGGWNLIRQSHSFRPWRY